MPGEITLLLKPKEDIYPWVKLDSKYIGIRVSGKEEVCSLIIQALIRALRGYIIGKHIWKR